MSLEFTNKKRYAGATWKWTESLDDYPASSGWSLVIILKHKTDSAITLTSNASGDDFDFNISASDTRALTKRYYTYQAVAAKSGEVEIIEEGEIEIIPMLDLAADLRTSNEKILDAIIAALESRATKEQQSISIAGRQIQYLTLEELINAKKVFEALVAKEKRIASGKTGVPRILERY